MYTTILFVYSQKNNTKAILNSVVGIAISNCTGNPRAYISKAMITSDKIAFTNDNALVAPATIGANVSCTRITIDLYRPIIFSFIGVD